ncbi:hypothetical protein Plim_2157 [Planctopirus limnophila DSM 3776]|uniref:Uncharacterized protein n=1 Tax=Planctopirus limnophila (strain ATCC 43296 / DSM 3776 / IFAM 1008 / Mu 290) TaxID=521674 RepID=D5SMS8_PLAL2|nr:hypothetical protein Plim_2157 [Planctopirus limnophila DSM 3776]
MLSSTFGRKFIQSRREVSHWETDYYSLDFDFLEQAWEGVFLP